jgi:dTDP-4-amino-4,6-dideoxygalactose transaminase
MERRVEARWSSDANALVCLSVRSGLDLLLAALEYPKGSEILVSAITIRDMVRIVEQHELLPVPVDLNMQTLNIRMESLKRALGPRTKAILVAHLFGSRMDLDEVGVFAREHGLLLIEDCAQSFTGLQYRGHPASDVTMFSFGPIKTSTALGGAILGIKDRSLLARMRALKSHHPMQTRWHFFRRVCRFALVRLLLCRVPFTLFCSACRLLNKNHDEVICHSVRGFSGPDFFSNIRRQASYPLLALLRRRLDRFHGKGVARRTAAAQTILRSAPTLPRPGRDAAHHSYWTFPVQSPTPDALVSHLWRRGFDATRGAWSLYAVPAPAQCAHLTAPEAQEAMRQVVYLPVHPELSGKELQRLIRAALEFDEDGIPATSTDCPSGTASP